MAALEMRPPVAEPRATESVPRIIELVGRLLDSGHAYLSGGTVYFDVSTFPDFGKLSHYPEDRMIKLARARGGNPDDPHRRAPLDFVLWQPSLADEPAWRAPFGAGRPGWHIECSAMVMHEHGPTVDLHGGGTDLVFPHHECEIAQSESLTGRAARAALDALGDGELRGREDVEVARQPRVRERPAEDRRPACDPARAHCATTTAPVSSGTTPTSTKRSRCCTGCSPRPSAPTGPDPRAVRAAGARRASTTTSTRPHALEALDDLAERDPLRRLRPDRARVLRELGALLGVDLQRPIGDGAGG